MATITADADKKPMWQSPNSKTFPQINKADASPSATQFHGGGIITLITNNNKIVIPSALQWSGLLEVPGSCPVSPILFEDQSSQV